LPTYRPFKTMRRTEPSLHGDKSTHLYNSVADPGCLSEIPDLNFFHRGFQVKNIPDPGSRIRLRICITEF
jgi:hypothetical protein